MKVRDNSLHHLRKAGYGEFVELGRGAQGIVYRARQNSLDRFVAVKQIICRETDECKVLREQLTRISRLNIPYVPSLYEIIGKGTTFYAIMEYHEGIALDPSTTSGWTLEVKSRVAFAVCAAVAAIHDEQWSHGDLKPSNVLLTVDGDCKIIDLGFARKTGHPGRQTIMGTPLYMAPEVKLCSVKDFRRADIYSLGVLLLELFEGRQFFDNGNPGAMPDNAINLPGPAKAVLKNCLDPDPEKRPRSAGDVAAAFRGDLRSIDNRIGRAGLSAHVKPLLAARMARSCVAAAGPMAGAFPEEAYQLACEAIEWDPDSTEAITLLDTLSMHTKRRKSRLTAISAGIAAGALIICIGAAVLWHRSHHEIPGRFNVIDPAPDSSAAYARLLLTPRKSKARITASVPLRTESGDGPSFARLRIPDIPGGAVISIDGTSTVARPGDSFLTVSSGRHEISINRGPDRLWRKIIDVAPFETFTIDLDDTRKEKP